MPSGTMVFNAFKCVIGGMEKVGDTSQTNPAKWKFHLRKTTKGKETFHLQTIRRDHHWLGVVAVVTMICLRMRSDLLDNAIGAKLV